MLGNQLHHCAGLHDPVYGRLHDDGNMADQGQHEASDEAHIVIKRKPTVNAILECKANCGSEMVYLTKHRSVGKSDALLQAGRTCGMLNKRDLIRMGMRGSERSSDWH